MSIDDPNVIDGVGIDKECGHLRLLITDHYEWKQRENDIDEKEHLLLLQEKINAYLGFLESKQYMETYPDTEFKLAIIEIRFKYDITENCEKFLQAVQNQVGGYGIKIEAHVS